MQPLRATSSFHLLCAGFQTIPEADRIASVRASTAPQELLGHPSGLDAEIHMRTDANNLVSTASTTHSPEQQETIHMIQMLRKEACSGAIADLSHVRTEHCLSDCLTKRSANPRNLLNSVQTGWLKEIDPHPPFRSMIEHTKPFERLAPKGVCGFRFSATCHVHAGAVVSCVLQQVRDVSQFMCMFWKSCWSLFKFVPALLNSAGSKLK